MNFSLIPVVPTRRGPAGDTLGQTRYVLLLRTPPGSPSSSCCCSSSPPGDTKHSSRFDVTWDSNLQSSPSRAGRTRRPSASWWRRSRRCPGWSDRGRCSPPASVTSGRFSDQAQQLHLQRNRSLPYLTGLVCFDVRTSDHERNPDVKLVELPLVQRKRELTWRAK